MLNNKQLASDRFTSNDDDDCEALVYILLNKF
jgi:hypothetical protein